MSERTVDLIRTDLQQAKNEAKKNILLPVREVSDMLTLVDSLQQQVKNLSEYKVSSKQFGELYDKAIAVVRQNEINKKKADDNYRALLEDTVQLRDQLAERDRTIALLTKQITDEVAISAKAIAESELFKGSFEHWNKEAHRVVDENNKLRKVLEVATDALNGILNGEWSETLDDQFLEVFTTRRINPSQIADEALLEINRELEALGE